MKAAIRKAYGGPEILEVRDVAKPRPKGNQVLIRVKYASLNSWDWDWLRGIPRIYRLLSGIFSPRDIILGCDFSGIVEEVGSRVQNFKPGDEVFGDVSGCGFGAFAENVCANEQFLCHKSPQISFRDAAMIPQAGLLALQGLRDFRKIEPGQEVLINGAGGGTGAFAIQLAKLYGAEITAVDLESKHEFMISLGADRVSDFTREDITMADRKFDFILDVMGHHKAGDIRKILKKNGQYVILGGAVSSLLSILISGSIFSKLSQQNFVLLVHKVNADDMSYLEGLILDGKLRPAIDKEYALDDINQAFEYFGSGVFRGKVVIKLE